MLTPSVGVRATATAIAAGAELLDEGTGLDGGGLVDPEAEGLAVGCGEFVDADREGPGGTVLPPGAPSPTAMTRCDGAPETSTTPGGEPALERPADGVPGRTGAVTATVGPGGAPEASGAIPASANGAYSAAPAAAAANPHHAPVGERTHAPARVSDG